ncbi:MAG: T9SS type A sorting domain-containing protein [Fibrobacteres bacterium]|nr:T9SS type A sorting domain-containing protein [Fibrobacterota bacterium]
MKKFALVLFLISAVINGATFVQQPALNQVNGKFIITFSVSDQIDVEVAIIDQDGKVAKHLAAGVLGVATPPPEPLSAGLAQSIEWDGFGDNGEVLAAGTYSVRVRLGMFLGFDKRISSRLYSATQMQAISYWNDTCKAYPGHLGIDSNISIDTIIPMTHPVWRQNSAKGTWTETWADGSLKIKLYEGNTKLDINVSDSDDRILMHNHASQLSRPSSKALIDGVTGNTLKIWTITNALFANKQYPFYGESIFDWNGKFILRDIGNLENSIFRFTPQGDPLNFTSGVNYFDQATHTGTDMRQRGLATDRFNNIYQGHNPNVGDPNIPAIPAGGEWYVVSKYDSNGVLVNDSILKIWGNIGQGIRIDPKGNIFAGIRVRPYPDTVPKEIKGLIKGGVSDIYSSEYWAKVIYGSIAKFSPDGGRVVPDAAGNLMGGPFWGAGRAKAVGMQWMHFGASFQPTHSSLPGHTCICYAPRFDVDRFGRVLFPNGFQNEFKALDNNGNLIFRAHNRDFIDKVKIGMISSVQVTDRGVYCADYINSQIVCFKWTSDEEKLLPVSMTAHEKMMFGAAEMKVAATPNPLTVQSAISYQLNTLGSASLAIYSADGKLVKDFGINGGNYRGALIWNGKDNAGRSLGNGMYFAVLKNGAKQVKIKLAVLR